MHKENAMYDFDRPRTARPDAAGTRADAGSTCPDATGIGTVALFFIGDSREI